MNFETKTKTLRNGIEFSHGLRRALTNALILIYFLSLGFNVVAVTTLFAISTLIMTFFEFPTGAIADYDSRKKSLMISFLLISISFLGIFLFTNFWVLAIFWILNDIAWTFTSGASSAWVIDALGYAKHKSKLVKLISNGYIFEKTGHIVGGAVGLLIVAMNFRAVWLVISITYFILFMISWRYMEERNFNPEKVPHNYLKKSLIKAKESFGYIFHQKNKNLKLILVGLFFEIIAFSGFIVCIPLILATNFNISIEYLPGIYAIISIIALLGPLIVHKFINGHGFGKSLFTILGSIGVFMIILSISKSIIVVLVVLAIIKTLEAAQDVSTDSARQHEFSSKIRASLGSINSINWAIANSIGIFLAGLAINFWGTSITLVISGAISIFAAAIYLKIKI
jgi:MFS family permease